MAQGDLTLFDDYSRQLLVGTSNKASGGDDIKVALIDSLPIGTESTPVLTTFTEVSGTNYTPGGESLLSGQDVSVVSGSTW